MIPTRRLAVVLALVLLSTTRAPADPPEVRPGAAFDYRPFSPERWKQQKTSTRMVPWEGRSVVLLTTSADLEPAVIGRFLARLDEGWETYIELVDSHPAPLKQYRGKPTIAAVPGAGLTCGYGCGYVGSSGIEVAGFYDHDYPLVARAHESFPHYYFYEMGRNHFTFGDRHSAFTTGYAVFMRYVCMDALKCGDEDAATRRAIEIAEARLERTKLTFLQAFTNVAGMDEKVARIPGLSPSDQPVMYASAMLRLRRENGGDAWVRRFFQALREVPVCRPDTQDGALGQSLGWFVAASVAARKDLSDVFADRWRLPLGVKTRAALKSIAWSRSSLSAADVLSRLPADELPKGISIGEPVKTKSRPKAAFRH
jgi:hypothetical protein